MSDWLQLAIGVTTSVLVPFVSFWLAFDPSRFVEWAWAFGRFARQVVRTTRWTVGVGFWAMVVALPFLLLLVFPSTTVAKLAQFGGSGLVFLGILQRDREFGQPLKQSVRRAVAELRAIWRARAVALVARGNISATASMFGRVTVRRGNDGTLEGRLRSLEENLKMVENDLREELSAERKARGAGQKRLVEQQSAIRKEVGELRETLKRTQVGNLPWEIVGLFWTLTGTLLAQ